MSGRFIVVGRVSGLHGVKGWLKVFSYTEPLDNIVRYKPWLLERDEHAMRFEVDAGARHGKGVIAHLGGVDDRDAAATLVGANILVDRDQFSRAGDDEFYWADLIGLDVATKSGVSLGKVDSLMETGANDVLVVHGDRRRLVPFVMDEVIRDVDLRAGQVIVEWDPEF